MFSASCDIHDSMFQVKDLLQYKDWKIEDSCSETSYHSAAVMAGMSACVSG